MYRKRCDIRQKDILFVRDGTYLIGSTALITKYDMEILFQSHIYKIRVMKPEIVSSYLLLAVLNSPLVKKQIRAKQFTQDIIDSLGKRITEIIIPVPKDKEFKKNIEQTVKAIVEQRSELRNQAREIAIQVIGKSQKEITEEEKELMEQL
jgi:type I restriction enzyme M protein